MNKIVFATGNEGKMKEIRMVLENPDYEILSMKEAGVELDIEEDGVTFEENALIKAKAVWNQTHGIVLADDSGLEVDYMDKKPGVFSARFLGEDTSYDVKNQYIIDQLEQAGEEQRTARFVCVIACVMPDGATYTAKSTIEGVIAHQISGKNGFGYDPIFYVPEYGCTTAELSPEQKNEISHRGKALREMKKILYRDAH